MRADTWGPLGSAFAAACCLGFAPLLSALTAVGLGFLIHDAILIPILGAFLGLTLWQLHRDHRRHGAAGPLAAGWPGALLTLGGLWLRPGVVGAGLVLLVAGAVWNLILVLGLRRAKAERVEG